MIKREPGFLGLAKQNAKRKGKYASKKGAGKDGIVDKDHRLAVLTNTEVEA